MRRRRDCRPSKAGACGATGTVATLYVDGEVAVKTANVPANVGLVAGGVTEERARRAGEVVFGVPE